MKISLVSSTLGLGLLVALSSLNCSSGSSAKGHDAAAGADGGDGAAGHAAAAGSDGAAGSGTAGGGAAGSDGAADSGAAGSDAAMGADGAAGNDGAAGDGATGDAVEGGDGANAPSALESAELALTDSTDPNLLTATHLDAADGAQTPIGWGPRTLPSQQQRDAAAALIRRLGALLPNSARNTTNTGGYTRTDVNVLNALLTLDADPQDLFSGDSLAPSTGTAWDAYKAGAVADAFTTPGLAYPDGVPATSSDATFGAYIAAHASDPEGVVGLATNIVKVALQHGLEDQLKAF